MKTYKDYDIAEMFEKLIRDNTFHAERIDDLFERYGSIDDERFSQLIEKENVRIVLHEIADCIINKNTPTVKRERLNESYPYKSMKYSASLTVVPTEELRLILKYINKIKDVDPYSLIWREAVNEH